MYGNPEAYRRIGIPEDTTLVELAKLITEWDEFDSYPSDLINLQRCLMTLNGVASLTGAGNPRPSSMWR